MELELVAVAEQLSFTRAASALGITAETIPAAAGYLSAPPDTPAHLRLPDRGRPRVGLVWAGSPDNKIDLRRSISAGTFAPLTAVCSTRRASPCALAPSG